MPKRRLQEIIKKVKTGKKIDNREARCLVTELERLHTIAKELEDDLEMISVERQFLNEFY